MEGERKGMEMGRAGLVLGHPGLHETMFPICPTSVKLRANRQWNSLGRKREGHFLGDDRMQRSCGRGRGYEEPSAELANQEGGTDWRLE